jgi:hypothetical protein
MLYNDINVKNHYMKRQVMFHGESSCKGNFSREK